MTIRVAVFSAKPFDRESLAVANREHGFALEFSDERLMAASAPRAAGCIAISAFVNDALDRPTLVALREAGVGLVVLRSAGYNHVDRAAAAELGLAVANVPAYSPYAIAEHATALILALDRKLHLAWNRVRGWDFSLDGLMGFDLHGRTVGVVGTGRIGTAFARIMTGFGCRVLATDPLVNEDCVRIGVRYVALAELLRESDVVSLHCPLTAGNRHLIDAAALAVLKRGAMLINTARGPLLDTAAAIEALKSGQLGALGIDVYEREEQVFFEDWSRRMLTDDVLARLLGFPNVLVTAHQGFLTRDALANIAQATMENIQAFVRCGVPTHPLPPP